VNDQYGHLTGAEAVRTVGNIIGGRLPASAVACRYGGDEFVIAIPDCTSVVARRVAEDLCRAVRETAPVLAGRAFGSGYLSISVGVACALLTGDATSDAWPPDDVEAGEALFREADAALYRAKAGGRNRVWVA
jgi:diguanylate cyclase (GGDEF)-like protein